MLLVCLGLSCAGKRVGVDPCGGAGVGHGVRGYLGDCFGNIVDVGRASRLPLGPS